MKIREIYLKNFGKFTEKRIQFSDGITIIYGENESGKSTLHNFIKSMLFGMGRGRGRASVNDTFSHHEPWENPNCYAGSLKLESGGKIFSIHRNFDKYSKKTEVICQDDGEQLSVENGDLYMLLDGMTEAVYENTVSTGQLKTAPNQPLAAALQNYATNYYAAGDGELDLVSAMEHLKKRKKEIEKETENIIHNKQEKREQIEREASYVWRDIHQLREEAETLEEEIQNLQQKEEQESVKKKRFLDELRPDKWRIHPVELLLFLLIILVPRFFLPDPWDSLVSIIIFLCCGIYVWNRLKVGKKQEKTESEKMLEEISRESMSAEKLLWKQEGLLTLVKEKETQYSNLQEQLEELEEMGDYFQQQEVKKQAVLMAERKILELSEKMQIRLRNILNERTSQILSEITDGKYTRLFVEENLQMSVFYNERRVSAEKLSRGTIEQIYFALRMAAAEMLREEEQPVIFDDTFVFYDDVRLENTLKWLNENKKQVILLTCQKREEELLKKNHIAYKKEAL